MPISNGLLLPIILLLLTLSPNAPVLGQQSFNRPDPLQHFRPYHGDFDVRNRHYWASAAFTGVHGYAMAGIWILGGLGFGIFMVVKNLIGNSQEIAERSKSHSFCFFIFFIIFVFTFFAIVFSGLVLAGNKSFNSRTKKVKENLVGTAGDVRKTIRRVTHAMDKMHILCPYEKLTCDRSLMASKKLQTDSQTIRRVVHRNSRSIDLALSIWYGTIAGIVSLNLVLVVAAAVLLLLHCRPGFIMIIFMCWILTVLFWVLSGFHFFVYTVIEDACVAFEEFKGSSSHSSLKSILPCLNLTDADQIMVDIRFEIHNFISKLNLKIAGLGGMIGPDEQHDVSFGGFFNICNPFSSGPYYRYDPGRCSKDAIPIGDITNVLGRITCPESSSSRICKGGRKFLSDDSFNRAQAYTQAIQGLIDVLPDLQSLTHCSFVEDTLSTVLLHQCRPMKVSIRLLWASTVGLSTCMVALEVVWIVKAFQDRGRNIYQLRT
ncbi:hypothetical protein AAC387_Pa02g3155 [Persea americana]